MLLLHFIYEASGSSESQKLNALAKFLYNFYGFDGTENSFSVDEIYSILKQFSSKYNVDISNISNVLSSYKQGKEELRTTIMPICSVEDQYTIEAVRIVSTGLINDLEQRKDICFIAYASEPPIYFTQEEFNNIFHNGLKNV